METSNRINEARFQLFELEERGEQMQPREVQSKRELLEQLIKTIGSSGNLSPEQSADLRALSSRLASLEKPPSWNDRLSSIWRGVAGVFTGSQVYMASMLSSDEIKQHIPEGVSENDILSLPRYHGWYLTFKGSTDRSVQAACQEILTESVRYASFSLSQTPLRGEHTWRGDITNPIPILTSMLQDPGCELECLDLSFSGVSTTELIEILEALPDATKLKCIYVGPQSKRSQVYTPDKDLVRLADYLDDHAPRVLVLGLSELHVLVGDRETKRLAEYDGPERADIATIRNYHNALAPRIAFDAKPPALSLPGPRHGSTNH